MGLAPDVFWSLLVREFWIKHRAFERDESRRHSLFVELAARTGHFNENDQRRMMQSAYQLKRYPLKKWLLPKSP